MPVYTGLLIRRAQQAHVALWQKLVSSEITGPQFGVLRALKENPGWSQSDLCNELDLDRSTIADLIARLVDKNLVDRVDHESDKRRYSLTLSDLGSSEIFALEPKVAVLDAALTKRLSTFEHDELQRLLALVVSQPELESTNHEL